MSLDQLQSGQTARVTGLSTEGPERRRLMDLGILPGARIAVHMRSPLGDPTAYTVRETTVALRRHQAQKIQISLETQEQ